MRVRPTCSFLAAFLLFAGAASAQDKPATPAAKPGAPAAKQEPELPSAPARLWIIAPTATGSWTMRIDNEGTKPIRIPADVRLLRFEVDTTEVLPAKGGAQKPTIRHKKTKCAVPRSMRPDSFPEPRALLLPPGHSYFEEFDPRLVCFGRDAAALSGGALVRARFGWDPPPKGARKVSPPFAAEPTENPATVAPLRELTAPPFVLSYRTDPEPKAPEPDPGPSATGAKPEDKAKTAKPPPPVDPAKQKPPEPPRSSPEVSDDRAPLLVVTTAPYADAAAARNLSITVAATNVGYRPTLVAVRPRMFSFEILGPDKSVSCDASSATATMPRESYKTLKRGDKVSFTMLLAEVCPRQAFSRVGMYRVRATLHASESGDRYGLTAYTGVTEAKVPTLVRLQSAAEPFYRDPPAAIPTPKPPPGAD